MKLPDAQTLAELRERTAGGTLGIEVIEMSAERVVLECDVTSRVVQPFGYLHGGINALLGEECASIGAWMGAEEGCSVVGVEINANHLRAVRSGRVRAVGTPVRQGRSIAVWDTTITDDQQRVCSVARCTVAIRPPAAQR